MNSGVEPREMETKHKWQPAPKPGLCALSQHALFMLSQLPSHSQASKAGSKSNT